MNPTTPPARRLLAVLLLVLASLGGVAASWADGLAERGARAAVAHVEGQDQGPCAPTHDHERCGFCRVLRELPDAPAAVAVVPAIVGDGGAPPSDVRSAPTVSAAQPGARAPPALA